MSEMIRRVALAICKSRTCEGVACCQWPANMGRTRCNAKQGAYDDAARAAIEALREPTEELREIMGAHASNGMVNWNDYHDAMIDAVLK